MSNSKITIPLDLPDVNVIEVKIEKNRLRISVESHIKGTRCGRCGRVIDKLHETGAWIEVRDLPVLGQEVVIRYRPKRYRCPYCEGGPTTTQVLSWHVPPSPFTRAYEDYLLKALVHSTVQDVSQQEGLGYDAVLGVMQRREGGGLVRIELFGCVGY
jgi:transposase